METVRALVLADYDEGPRLRDVSLGAPGPGEVRVRIGASGICGSDLHLVHGRSNAAHLPAVMGHEGAGEVEAVGAGVVRVAPGDRVVIAMLAPCGSCARCAEGRVHLCEDPGRWARIRGEMPDGSFRMHDSGAALHPFVGCGSLAERVVVTEAQLIPVPDGVPLEVAAISACGVMTGVGAVLNIAKPAPGSTALVLGCGGVGLSVIQACRLVGVARIVAVDANPAKLPLAKQLGATDVVDSSAAELADAVRAILPGGADTSFEVVGRPELLSQAFELTRSGGTCVATATYPPGSQLSVSAQSLFWDRQLRGCLAGNASPQADVTRILRLYLAGRLDLDALVSRRFAFGDVHAALAATERGDVARAVVTFEETR